MIEPSYNAGGVRIYRGDARRLVTEPLGTVHAVVTDPPYELGLDGLSWDRSGVAFDARFWRRVLMKVQPGGWMLCFGAPRFLGRLQLALEDGGWSYEDTMMWIYGQGFPKGRTRLKPAYEPIVLCRRPGGARRELNVDGAGIGGKVSETRTSRTGQRSLLRTPPTLPPVVLPGRESRWPTNVILDEDSAAEVDRQSGVTASTRSVHHHTKRPGDLYLKGRVVPNIAGYDDEGGASRFFYCAKATKREKERVNQHVAVKPLDLMRHLVELVTFPGEVVLDPFLGSGTTAVAALLTGRRCVGFEQDQRSIDVSARRLRRAAIRGGTHGDEERVGAPGPGAPEPVELPPPGRAGEEG